MKLGHQTTHFTTARTKLRSLRTRVILAALFACLLLPRLVRLESADPGWPPFLPRTGDARTDDAVGQIYNHGTFARSLNAAPLNVPVDLYVALIDAPEVAAAAANHLGIASDSVKLLPGGGYELHAQDGSMASIRVLLKRPMERVTLSEGQLNIHGLRIRGSVLGLLKLSAGADVRQELDAYVRVDNPALAWLTKALLPLVSSRVNAVLTRGFTITGAVATWARERREEFCPWLESSGFSRERLLPIGSAAKCGSYGES